MFTCAFVSPGKHELLLNPMITGERPLTAIVTAHLIKISLLICIHELLSCTLGFKKSVLDMGKISAFIVQKYGVSKWRIWQDRGRVIEAEYNKVVMIRWSRQSICNKIVITIGGYNNLLKQRLDFLEWVVQNHL